MECTELKLRAESGYLPKDFVETASGHFFALVAPGVECGRVMATLRYVADVDGSMRKLSSEAASQEISRAQNRWDYFCPRRDVRLHAVACDEIMRHYSPSEAWPRLLRHSHRGSAFGRLHQLFEVGTCGDVGVTGSHLLGAASLDSDIDLVVYGAARFEDCRQRVHAAIRSGAAYELSESQWRDAYQRRGCELNYDAYAWHEKRKFNKFSMDGVKVDLSCVDTPPSASGGQARKICQLRLQARVTSDSLAFATPAVYGVEHPRVESIVCFTPTYAGQARVGEWVEACGWLEQDLHSRQCSLLIGTSREAKAEFMKVIPLRG